MTTIPNDSAPATPEVPIYVVTAEDRISLCLKWASEFGLIEWYPDGEGGFLFGPKRCCDHDCT